MDKMIQTLAFHLVYVASNGITTLQPSMTCSGLTGSVQPPMACSGLTGSVQPPMAGSGLTGSVKI